MSIAAERLAFEVVHENPAIAGYANQVAALEFPEPQIVDRKLLPDDAALDLPAFGTSESRA